MPKRGSCPSLIGTTHGSVNIKTADRKVTCKRCDGNPDRGSQYASVSKPGSMGRRSYCLNCLGEIIQRSKKDLDKLERLLQITPE